MPKIDRKTISNKNTIIKNLKKIINPENILEKDDDVIDNRERFINFCIANNMKAMNTFFLKKQKNC